MKTKLLLPALLSYSSDKAFSFLRFTFVFCLLSFVFLNLSSQVPEGFNYQAIATYSGSPVTTAITVRITIQELETGGETFWIEDHLGVIPNSQGLFNIVIGTGVMVAGSTAASFADIDWSVSPKYLKTDIDYLGWKPMGVSKLQSVPYSMVAEKIVNPVNKIGIKGTTTNMEEALFEVRNSTGQIVFAVYNEGVRIYVDDGSKGSKGGFAIGGFDVEEKGLVPGPELLVVDPTKIRMYIDQAAAVKSPKGGFAIGGFDAAKGYPIQTYMRITNDSTKFFINDDPATKGPKGGFAIGGFDEAKGVKNFFNVESPLATPSVINPSENRILFHPLKNAFLVGKVLITDIANVGENSFVSGFESKAKGMYSQALGYKTVALGDNSTAIGNNAAANANNSFAFGDGAIANSLNSYAFGKTSTANGQNSFALGESVTAGATTSITNAFAFGLNSQAKANSSFAFGNVAIAESTGSYAFGIDATAKGQYSFALGQSVTAGATTSVSNAYAFGKSSQANANGSFAFGNVAKAMSAGSYAFGTDATANGQNSFALGQSVTAGATTSITNAYAFGLSAQAKANSSYAMGESVTAWNPNSYALGKSSIADGNNAFVMGLESTATGESSIAMGYRVKALKKYSVAIGSGGQIAVPPYTAIYTTADGVNSIAMGQYARSVGESSIALGSNSYAEAQNSVAIGFGSWSVGLGTLSFGNLTTATSSYSTALGYYNISYGSPTAVNPMDPLFMIGNGFWSSESKVVNSSGEVGGSASFSIKYKENVYDFDNYSWLYDLRPVTYNYKNYNPADIQYGLIAEEVDSVNPLLVVYGSDNKPDGLMYEKLTVPMLKAIQEQQKQINSLKEENVILKEKLSELDLLKSELEQIKALLQNQE
ncbi:MAG: tail fiber domain-containing protein [Bacteroidales bacterium]|nr:tail fiber domain-containing protein [Bacteroidales bacterium]